MASVIPFFCALKPQQIFSTASATDSDTVRNPIRLRTQSDQTPNAIPQLYSSLPRIIL